MCGSQHAACLGWLAMSASLSGQAGTRMRVFRLVTAWRHTSVKKVAGIQPHGTDQAASLDMATTRLDFPKIEDRPAAAPGASSALRISVIIPALNEADNLPTVLCRIPTWV